MSLNPAVVLLDYSNQTDLWGLCYRVEYLHGDRRGVISFMMQLQLLLW